MAKDTKRESAIFFVSLALFCSMMNNTIFTKRYFPSPNDELGFSNPSLPGKQQETAMDLKTVESNTSNNNAKAWTNHKKTTTIAYATTVTSCSLSKQDKLQNLLGGAAVLHYSIKKAHQTSEFGYHMMAFLHPEVDEYCRLMFQNLGYEIQIRDTPFNESSVVNQKLVNAQASTCCRFKEYLKLYAYVQFQYPVVVHLDLDVMVLKPMDDLFRLMIYNQTDDSSNQVKAQWAKQPSDYPPTVDFAFTRDYPQVRPGFRQPYQVGVQGGFFVVRPNQTDFDTYIDIILQKDSYSHRNWGGPSKGYGGYWGDGTVQGLFPYYYGEYAKNRSLELNRCYYNQMADDPLGVPQGEAEQPGNQSQKMCRTLEPKSVCQDCRLTPMEEIYTIHFTVCRKPQECNIPRAQCSHFLRAWHKARYELELEWAERFGNYNGLLLNTTRSNGTYHPDVYYGHCQKTRSYIPMNFPPPIHTLI